MRPLILFLTGFATLFCTLAATAGSLRNSPSVPADNPINPAKVALGRRLFYDADLSVNGTMSCATCHEQHHGFADGNRTHPGATDDPGRRNVPGLANVAWLPRLTSADPRLTSLEKQIAIPLFGTHPVEMAMLGHEDEIAKRLGHDPCYVAMFRSAFPQSGGRIDYDNVAKAIASFERTLISHDSPFDQFLRGQKDALSLDAREGAHRFKLACASCHSGPDFTEADYHRIAADGAKSTDDMGLAEVTGKAADIGKFRTPGLRNIGVTAPYLHDGSAASLEDAIRAHRSFAAMSPTDLAPLLAFLGTLTDQQFLTDPKLALPAAACGKPL